MLYERSVFITFFQRSYFHFKPVKSHAGPHVLQQEAACCTEHILSRLNISDGPKKLQLNGQHPILA